MNALKELARNLVALVLFVVLCLFLDQMTPETENHAFRSAQFYGMKEFNLDEHSSVVTDHNKFWGVPSL